MKILTRNVMMILMWVSLTAIACNLGGAETPPPTLSPKITAEPMATIGYATQVPGIQETQVLSAPPTPIATRLYTMLEQVDSDRLMYHIAQLQNFHTRHSNSVGRTDGKGISAAYEYLNAEFTKIQDQSNGRFTNLSPHRFTMTYNGVTTEQRNVFGVITGTEPNTGVIVVGAHYDSRTDDLTDSTSSAPGADDNGSGTAAILELARVMSQYPTRITVIFVLFSGEEQGIFGSNRFVDGYLEPNNIPVMVMINLDTIGNIHNARGDINDRDLRLFADPNHTPSRYIAQTMTFIAEQNSTDLRVVLQDRIDREGRFGDHLAFSNRGYPAVRFIEAHEETPRREGMDFIEYIEPYYLRNSTRTILTVLVGLANGPRPPDNRNIIIRDMDDGQRRLVWEQVPDAVGYVVALRQPGQGTFNHYFNAPGLSTAYNYDGFSRYEGLAIASISADGILGPLSPEYRIP